MGCRFALLHKFGSLRTTIRPFGRACSASVITNSEAPLIRDFAENAAVNRILDRCAVSGPPNYGHSTLGAETRVDIDFPSNLQLRRELPSSVGPEDTDSDDRVDAAMRVRVDDQVGP